MLEPSLHGRAVVGLPLCPAMLGTALTHVLLHRRPGRTPRAAEAIGGALLRQCGTWVVSTSDDDLPLAFGAWRGSCMASSTTRWISSSVRSCCSLLGCRGHAAFSLTSLGVGQARNTGPPRHGTDLVLGRQVPVAVQPLPAVVGWCLRLLRMHILGVRGMHARPSMQHWPLCVRLCPIYQPHLPGVHPI